MQLTERRIYLDVGISDSEISTHVLPNMSFFHPEPFRREHSEPFFGDHEQMRIFHSHTKDNR